MSSSVHKFYVACSKGREEIVRTFLANTQVDLNVVGGESLCTPVAAACREGLISIVKLLLFAEGFKSRIDITKKDKFGMDPFRHACRQGHAEIAECILQTLRDRSENIDLYSIVNGKIDGDTALHEAVFKRNSDVVRLLLNCPEVDPNILSDQEGLSALSMACQYEAVGIVALFVNAENNSAVAAAR